MGLVTLLITVALGADTADPAALAADLRKWDAALEKDGKYPLGWSDSELGQLAAGEVVKRRTKLDGADRALGAVWCAAPLAETWVAVQDEWHWGLVEGLIEEKMEGATFQDKLLYQRLEAPWPFKDRQWVIRVKNNLPLWEASGEQVIERYWHLSPERGAKNEIGDGVWVNVNDGAWLAAPAAGGTVVVYHVRAVVGGNIPDDAATTWTMLTLGGMMRGIAENSKKSRGHYVGDHPVIHWPDEDEIPRF